MTCTKDYCEIDENDYQKEAAEKLKAWLYRLEPMDYDAPGSTVREIGV